MAIKRLKRIHTGIPALETLQSQVDSALVDLQRNPFGGTFVTVSTNPTDDIVIAHGLGSAPNGYLPIVKSAAVDLYTSATVNRAPEKQLILRATASATVTLLS